MANAKRKCAYCKKYSTVESMFIRGAQVFCDKEHYIEYQVGNSKKLVATGKKIRHKKAKEAIKPKSKWLSELQALVNKYVRLRDINDGCISCDKDKHWNGQWHAGHYFSRGHSSSLRFNLNNIHKQCSVCNNHLSGNIGEYTPRLIDKIGNDKLNELIELKSAVASYDIDWIKRAISIFKRKIKKVESNEKN